MDWAEAFNRQCRWCGEWKSLDEYEPHYFWCVDCLSVRLNQRRYRQPNGQGAGRPRSIMITAKGRAYLKAMREPLAS